MAEIGVLGDVEANGDRRRVAIPYREIDVAHGRIECAGIGVCNGARLNRHSKEVWFLA